MCEPPIAVQELRTPQVHAPVKVRFAELRSGTFWNACSAGLARIVPALLTIVLAWMLTPRELGAISFVLAYYGMLVVFADWGIVYALQKFIPANREQLPSIAWTSLFVRLGTSITLGALCWALDSSVHIFRGYGLYIGILLVSSSFGIIIFIHFAELRFVHGGLIATCIQLLWLGLGTLLVAMGFGVSGPVWGLAIPYTIIGIIGFCLDSDLRRKIHFDKRTAIELLGFGAWATLASGMLVFVNQIGILALAYLRGETEAAVFKVASTLSMPPIIVCTLLLQPLLPFAARSLRCEPEEAIALLRLLIRYLLMIGIPLLVGGLILARPLVETFFNTTYLDGVWSLRILLFANSLTMLFTTLSAIPFMGSGLKYLARTNVIVAVVALITNILLVRSWGTTGAALAQLLSSGTGFILLLRWLKRTFPIASEWSRWSIYAISAGEMALAVTITVSLVHAPPLQLTLGVFVGVLAYGSALLIQKGVTLAELRRLFGQPSVPLQAD